MKEYKIEKVGYFQWIFKNAPPNGAQDFKSPVSTDSTTAAHVSNMIVHF